MASSFHVFENLNEYMNYYPNRTPIEYETPVLNIYRTDDGKIWIVTKTNPQKERPDLSKTIVHFRNGSADNYLNEKVKTVNKIRYNYKKNKLCFDDIEFRCTYRGNKLNHPSRLVDFFKGLVNIDRTYIHYDPTRDIVNFVIKAF